MKTYDSMPGAATGGAQPAQTAPEGNLGSMAAQAAALRVQKAPTDPGESVCIDIPVRWSHSQGWTIEALRKP